MKLRTIISSVRSDGEQGSILVWITLMSVPLLVFLAFAFDGGYFYQQKRRMQTAADSAALAGALEKKRNVDATSTEVVNIGRQDSAKNGFTHGSGNITVTINEPPLTGAYVGTAGSVEAVIAQQHQTFFASLFNLLAPGGNFNQATIRARAVAGPASSSCIHILHESAERAFEISSNSTVSGVIFHEELLGYAVDACQPAVLCFAKIGVPTSTPAGRPEQVWEA